MNEDLLREYMDYEASLVRDSRKMFLRRPPQVLVDEWEEPDDLPPIGFDPGYEAKCSTWIESETEWKGCERGIVSAQLLTSPRQQMQWAHDALMEKRPEVPRGWRRMNVRVGRYTAPHHAFVHDLMEDLGQFLLDEDTPRVLKAVWGHIQFESIHPFADGNGRTGRMLVNWILGRPFAPAVLADRSTYYRLLDKGSWHEWAEWMLHMLRTCPRIAPMKTNPWN